MKSAGNNLGEPLISPNGTHVIKIEPYVDEYNLDDTKTDDVLHSSINSSALEAFDHGSKYNDLFQRVLHKHTETEITLKNSYDNGLPFIFETGSDEAKTLTIPDRSPQHNSFKPSSYHSSPSHRSRGTLSYRRNSWIS